MDNLVSLIASLIEEKSSIPLSISLKDDKEVVSLRNQIAALEVKISTLQAQYDRAEYLYKCESILNNRLIDLCRVSGIEVGAEFFVRPVELQKNSLSEERTPPAKVAD